MTERDKGPNIEDVIRDELEEYGDLTNLSEVEVLHELGREVYLQEISRDSIGMHLPENYLDIGRMKLAAFWLKAHNKFCDPETNKPREWVENLIDGDVNQIAEAAAIFVAKEYYDSYISLAAPIGRALAKLGINKLCSTQFEVVDDEEDFNTDRRSIS